MNKYILLLSIMLLPLVVSCNPEQESETKPDTKAKIADLTFFESSQPEILAVSADQISLQFDFEGYKDIPIDEFGLIWYQEEDTVLYHNCVQTVIGQPADETIKFEIDNCLPFEKIIYFRAYIKIGCKIIYSQFVAVKSKGCKKPFVTNLIPENPSASQQIKIEGHYFVKTQNISLISVFVNDFQIKPDSATEEAIYFSLNSAFIESSRFSYELTLKLKILDKECPIYQKISLKNPWKSILLSSTFHYTVSSANGTAASLNDKGYLLYQGVDFLFVYDSKTDSWTTTDLPDLVYHVDEDVFCFTADNKFYALFKGMLYSKNTADIQKDKWQLEATYPTAYPTDNKPYFYFLDNWLYIGFFNNIIQHGGETNIREFKRYHILEKRWESLAPIPMDGGGIYSSFSFFYDGMLNFGTTRINGPYDYSSNYRIWSYSLSTNLWSWEFEGEYRDYPIYDGESTMKSFNDGTNIFIGLGENRDWPEYCSCYVWKLNKLCHRWEMIPRCPSKMLLTAWFSLGDKIYLLGTDEHYKKNFFYELDNSKL